MSRKYSIDSTDTIDSRSYSTDDNSDKHSIQISKPIKYTTQPTNKSTKIKLKRRKREQNLPELSISPPDKVDYYKHFLSIFNNE